MRSYLQNVSSVSFLQFMTNLQPSENQIPVAWFIKLTFSSKITLYPTKTENKIFPKIADIIKIKVVLVLKSIFSETNYVCVLRTKFEVSSIILTSFRLDEGVILPQTHQLLRKRHILNIAMIIFHCFYFK